MLEIKYNKDNNDDSIESKTITLCAKSKQEFEIIYILLTALMIHSKQEKISRYDLLKPSAFFLKALRNKENEPVGEYTFPEKAYLSFYTKTFLTEIITDFNMSDAFFFTTLQAVARI
jgi:hypothetical protein